MTDTIHEYWVWITEPSPDDNPATGAPYWGAWIFDARYSCKEEWPGDDGARRCASQRAHQYARFLRNTYPCSYVAVTPAGRQPLPIGGNRLPEMAA